MPNQNWKLSPSDFAFLWEECKRCFYLKVVEGFQRPRGIMPKIFTAIDNQMKAFFAGRSTIDFVPQLRKGTVSHFDEWVVSAPIAIPRHSSRCFVRGKLDTVITFDQGGYAVIDFKTAEAKGEHIPLYSRQLHAYAYSLEHAAAGHLALKPIERLGLLVFEPQAFSHQREGSASLSGGLTWIEIPRDERAFLRFLGEVLDILDLPKPPPAAANCEWCRYRDQSGQMRL